MYWNAYGHHLYIFSFFLFNRLPCVLVDSIFILDFVFILDFMFIIIYVYLLDPMFIIILGKRILFSGFINLNIEVIYSEQKYHITVSCNIYTLSIVIYLRLYFCIVLLFFLNWLHIAFLSISSCLGCLILLLFVVLYLHLWFLIWFYFNLRHHC